MIDVIAGEIFDFLLGEVWKFTWAWKWLENHSWSPCRKYRMARTKVGRRLWIRTTRHEHVPAIAEPRWQETGYALLYIEILIEPIYDKKDLTTSSCG
jgi:hypothetical protein